MTSLTSIQRAFAPTGKLRVALNHGNRVLVGRDADGRAQGISVDLATHLAKELEINFRFVEFERAVDVSSSVDDDVWDVAFLAVDPKRAETIAFTSPYIRIEGNYLVSDTYEPEDSSALIAEKVGIGSVKGTAYALALARLPVSAQLQLFEDMAAAIRAFDAGQIGAVAGIRKAMDEFAADRPHARVIEPPFMEIRQAMAMRNERDDAHSYLCDFLGRLAENGTIGDILERHGVDRSCAIHPNETHRQQMLVLK